jgi:hypothetical protein
VGHRALDPDERGGDRDYGNAQLGEHAGPALRTALAEDGQPTEGERAGNGPEDRDRPGCPPAQARRRSDPISNGRGRAQGQGQSQDQRVDHVAVIRHEIGHWHAGCQQDRPQSGQDQCEKQRRHEPAQGTENEAAARREDSSANSREESSCRLMGGPDLTSELGRRPQASERLPDRPCPVEPLGFERGNRVRHVIGKLHAHLGDVGRRQR